MKAIDNRITRALVFVVSLILSFPVFGQNADAVDPNLTLEGGYNETEVTRSSVGPLLKTHWKQNGAYNQYCPWKTIGNDQVRALTGCVPTAMAQLLYYYKQPVQETSINRPFFSLVETLKFENNITSVVFDYENPSNNKRAKKYEFRIGGWNYNSSNQQELAAMIMRDCGIAVDCQYGLGASGAFSVPYKEFKFGGVPYKGFREKYGMFQPTAYDAFKHYFGFPNAIFKEVNIGNENAIIDEMKKYLNNGDPIYLAYNEYNGMRHAAIIDGYTERTSNETIFYINMGDGYNSIGQDIHRILLDSEFRRAYIIMLNPEKCNVDFTNGSASKNQQTTNQIIYESVTKYHEYIDAMTGFISDILTEVYWQDEENGIDFWNLFQSLLDSNTGMITEDRILQLISQSPLDSISEDYIRFIAEGYNQSVMYWNEGYYTNESLPEGYGGMIEYDTAAMRKAYEAQAYAESLGFTDVRQMYDNAYEMLEAGVENQQSSVCAQVTVQFNQKMTMTREAFNGTLQIFNGHETLPMQDIMVDFRIEDQNGNDCTNLFQINTLSLDQVTGISGDGSLAAQANGTALVQFIPTRNAAPTQPVVYSFGGSFSFIDPFTGEGLTYPLYPVEITVNPSPDLHVKYFMPRDILGDNALTEDRVEPSVPAELGVIISNKGAGTAKNVTLETAEPEIIDNEKGLAINFTMSGASFNGCPRQLGLTEVPFGDIESGQTAVGEWLFTSPLLGHFVSYDAHVVHNSSYGNQDLSLVSHLDIHELIHPIFAYGNLDDGINDFLVNDNPDAYDTPDSIYFSHGGKTSVSLAESLAFDHFVSPENTVVTLTLNPSAIGWNYGETDDPGMNQYQIVSCVRNHDNQEIPLNNVWLTFVTMPDGGDPVYENKLHIIDTVPDNQAVSYTLEFAPKPSNLRIFNGNIDAYWSNPDNWEGNVMPLEDDEVLINGICQLDTDATVFSLTVSKNQSLTIPDGRFLTVSGDLTSEVASRLVIEEGGQLRHGSTGVRATVQKTILPYTEGERDGWYLITPPLVGTTDVTSVVNLLHNYYDLYYYDEPSAYWINQENTANGFTHLTNGKGYLYANSEETLLAFPGEIRNGSTTLNVLLNYTEGIALKGFNLVGNPFVYNLTSYATVNVANGCYQMNEDKSDFIVSEISEDNPLKPTEAFFVKAIDADASVTFNSGRGATSNPCGSLSLEISYEGKLLDRLIVKKEGVSLEKLSMNERRTKIYANQNQQEFAIVHLEGNEQPVSFKAVKNGTYTLATHTGNMKFDYLHLIDNLTGSDVDLLNSPNYTFKACTSDYASRFKLVFVLGAEDDSESENFGFFFDNKFCISDVEGEATFQVVDLMGRVLFSENFTGNYSKQLDYPAAVYIMRLINNKEVKNQKAVVR